MVSLDDPEKNRAFAESVGASFVLLSDPDKKAAEAYGVLAMGGLYTRRITFYIDAEGKIEGPANEPLLSELPVLGREQRSGRAEKRHGHVHALGRSKSTRSRCDAV